MGCVIEKKYLILISIISLATVCGISVGVYFYKISGTSSSSSHQVGQNHDEHEHMSGDDPNIHGIENGTLCVGAEYECQLRLDEALKPLHYDLYLYPDLKTSTFTGKVSISLKLDKTVDHIRLHTKYLNITETLLFTGLNKVGIQKTFEVPQNEYFVVLPESPLEPSRYNLTLVFNGSLTRGITGFYKSTYTNKAKQSKQVVSTKFQPTSARKAFPCFDEPGIKSTFTITLVKPSELVALSNMPVDIQTPDVPAKGLTTVKFQKSVKMVTYLVAVAIGEFNYTEGFSKRKVPVRVYSTPDHVEKTKYAASTVVKMIDFFEDYFNVEFPLPKLDIIGIPDFVSGAMEHWGLISFREVNLLYHPSVGSAGNKQRVATVLSHELAHMWFGNLVTIAWWDALYLNEGFASFMEYKGVNSVHADWEIEAQFGPADLAPVLKLDGQESSHPIVQEVTNPNQITEIFDSISYNKGSSVLRMLENIMTSAKFRHGVSRFLDEYAFKNVEAKDLWEFLQVEVNLGPKMNISLIMDTWTKQMGYPVIQVEIRNEAVQLTPERFVENRDKLKTLKDVKTSPFNYTWEIPLQVSFDYSNIENVTLQWIHHTDKSIQIPVGKNTTWLKVNTGQYGYFRVNYEENVWKAIKDSYHTDFSPIERCGLIDDVLSLADARYLNYSTSLDFITILTKEKHFVPWDCFYNHIQQLNKLLRNSAPTAYPLYRKLVTNLTSNLYDSFNWTDSEQDPHLQRLLKRIIFQLSCENGDPSCLKHTKELFDKYIVAKPENNPIPSTLRDLVYKWGMTQSNDTVWSEVWNRYLVEPDVQEKLRLLNCLSAIRDPWVIKSLLDRAKIETNIRRQDFFILTRYISQNPDGNPILWSYYRNEYQNLVERFSINDRYFGRMILDITSDFTSKSQLMEMRSLFAANPEAGAGRRARETALENVENNMEWVAHNVLIIEEWLKSHFA